MSTLDKEGPRASLDIDFGTELMSPDSFVDPHPLLHRVRREDPVHYSRKLGAWLVTRYDHVVQAFRDSRLGGDRTPFLIDGRRRGAARWRGTASRVSSRGTRPCGIRE
jgi:cytochrome P450